MPERERGSLVLEMDEWERGHSHRGGLEIYLAGRRSSRREVRAGERLVVGRWSSRLIGWEILIISEAVESEKGRNGKEIDRFGDGPAEERSESGEILIGWDILSGWETVKSSKRQSRREVQRFGDYGVGERSRSERG